MTPGLAYTELVRKLESIYDRSEAMNIAELVMENLTGMRKAERSLKKENLLDAQMMKLENYTTELLAKKPVQYVLNEAWFYDHKFFVNEHVLIPRPETEELVEWMIQQIENSEFNIQNIVDIGTGSGCIPISLKKKMPGIEVHALDISEAALDVAKKNAEMFGAEVYFHQNDILDETKWNGLPVFDIIVSNPPYIKQSEIEEMRENVVAFEPHLALFVPDNDALIFYKAIIQFAKERLTENGQLFFEINESLGREVLALLEENAFSNVELRKDMQQKDRMIKASKA